MNMNISQYLSRINYHGNLTPSLEVLTNLQKAHVRHVPFENLDIHFGRPLQLDQTYDKVVLRNRGGFCYELNGLFSELLSELGFTIQLVSARVYDKDKGYGFEFDHMAIIVTIDGDEYLTDVGFGEFVFAPLKIVLRSIQKDQRGEFMIDTEDGITLAVKKNIDNEFIPQYVFTKIPRVVSDFMGMCRYHQTSPDSHFTKKRLCSLPTEHGRVSLTGNVLKMTEGDQITEVPVETEEDFERVLWEYFRMRV